MSQSPPSIITKWLKHITPIDARRLRCMPHHSVHEAILNAVKRRDSTSRERLMLLYSPATLATSDKVTTSLDAYLMYRREQDNLIVVDCLYSPHERKGNGTHLLKALEARAGGKTIALMCTPDATSFFAKRGYAAPEPFKRAHVGLGRLLMIKYVWDEL